MDYTNKSVEEIDDILADLGKDKDAIRAEMREATAARDAKNIEEGWAAKVGGMNDAERDALKKMLNVQIAEPKGVGSKEEVTDFNG